MSRTAAKTEPSPSLCAPAWHLREAARRLHAGAVIAYPTEAVYGLGCDPLDARAVARLLELKQRPMSAGLILIAAEFAQVESFLEPLPAALRRQAFASWPGPVTWLLPARPEVPVWLRGRHDSLAVRITAHAGSAALCRAFGGALVSTSANPHGRAPARNPLQLHRYFGDRLGYILPGPLGGRGRPSEIRDGRSGRVVRPG